MCGAHHSMLHKYHVNTTLMRALGYSQPLLFSLPLQAHPCVQHKLQTQWSTYVLCKTCGCQCGMQPHQGALS